MGRVTDTETAPAGTPTEGTRARVERAALDLFTLRGFENVTTDEVADAAGISRRTFFRYYATKADAVWGDFTGHVSRLEQRLADSDPAQPVLASVCAAYVEVNDYADAELPLLRERMQLILTEPALLAHSQLRYADVDRVVAEHVARRTGTTATALVPRLVAASTRAAATTAFQMWLADEGSSLTVQLHQTLDEMAHGFPTLSR
jgi:TetR/AcrR family transcriptional regulator, regulator of mycofactocin system